MGRELHRMSVKTVETRKKPGYYADGGNLWLQVSSSGSKSWVFRYTLKGRAREMGLGSERDIKLGQAREDAADYRKMLAQGVDPLEVRRAAKAQGALAKARGITFDESAKAYIEAHRARWKNAKHADQWTNTVATYCSPIIGTLPVGSIDTPLVLKVLEPIWTEKHETATRVRQRIEAILDRATARGDRTGENPARWKGHLDKILPSIQKKARVRHHAALTYTQLGTFMEQLRSQEGVAARALEFTILTAARTGEVVLAKSEEFDLDKRVWTVPASRMKAGREHRVPLASRAVELIRAQIKQGGEYVFPGLRDGRPLSTMAMLKLLERMGRGDITVHGFRSTFKDWAAESAAFPNIVSELALAHTISDQTEAAYRRGDLFEKRRRLITEWAKYCERRSPQGVVPIKRTA